MIEHLIGNKPKPSYYDLLEDTFFEYGEISPNILNKLHDHFPLFKDLSFSQFVNLLQDSEILKKQKDEIIYNDKAESHSLFHLVEGELELEFSDLQSIKVEEGDFFGEQCLLTKSRLQTARMAKFGYVLETPREQIVNLINLIPESQTQLLKVAKERDLLNDLEVRGHIDISPTKVTTISSYCLLYTSPSPRDKRQSRMPSSA